MPQSPYFCADQTCLELFFFLHLGRQNRYSRSTGISGTLSEGDFYSVARPIRHGQKKGRKNVGRTQHQTKPYVVIPVVGLIPVAVGAARVVSLVVERTAPHDLSRPPDRMFPSGHGMVA